MHAMASYRLVVLSFRDNAHVYTYALWRASRQDRDKEAKDEKVLEPRGKTNKEGRENKGQQREEKKKIQPSQPDARKRAGCGQSSTKIKREFKRRPNARAGSVELAGAGQNCSMSSSSSECAPVLVQCYPRIQLCWGKGVWVGDIALYRRLIMSPAQLAAELAKTKNMEKKDECTRR